MSSPICARKIFFVRPGANDGAGALPVLTTPKERGPAAEAAVRAARAPARLAEAAAPRTTTRRKQRAIEYR